MLYKLLLRFFSLFAIHIPAKLHRLMLALLLFFLSLAVGIFGFIYLEGYSLVNAFYMTVITLATVGFTEVQPLSDTGKIFTSFFIIYNLGVFALIISAITSYLVEGELVEVLNIYRLNQKVKKLHNHVIICGFGRNGNRACQEFVKHHIPFVVIETDSEKILEAKTLHKEMFIIEGDATHDEILELAGVTRAKALISALPKDADNVYVTLTARQLNPKIKIVARANESGSESKLLMAGADKLVRPDQIGGMYMANLIMKPEIVEFLDLLSGTGVLKLEEFNYADFKEEFQNKTIRDLDARNKTGVMILGFKDNELGMLINPNPDMKIGIDDFMIVLGSKEQIEIFANTYTHR